MVYINSSTLIVNDNSQHCIETFDVTAIEMRDYAGVCGTRGYQLTGHRIDNVRLSYAMGAAFDGSQIIYSSSSGGDRKVIIGINMMSDMVHEVCDTDGMLTTSLMFDQSSQALFVSLAHAIGIVNISTEEFTILSGSATSGASTGHLKTTEYSSPFRVLQVNASTLLVADRYNDR